MLPKVSLQLTIWMKVCLEDVNSLMSSSDFFECFIYNTPKKMFPTLVKMFYSNLNYIDGVVTSEVRKQDIFLSFEEIDEICDLPYTDSLYKNDEIKASEKFNFDVVSQSILLKKIGCAFSSPCWLHASRYSSYSLCCNSYSHSEKIQPWVGLQN